MATKVWTGATDGNFGTATNWVGGVAPIANDDIVFSSGSVSVTAGLATGIQLGTIYIGPGYTGSIGSSAAALTATGNITAVKCYGQGSYYKIGASGNVGTNEGDVQITLAATSSFTLSSGTWARTQIKGGQFRVEDGTVVTTSFRVLNSQGVILGTTAGLVLVTNTNSSVTCYRAITNYQGQQAGALVLMSAAAISGTTDIFSGHTLNHRSTGTIAALNLNPGAAYSLVGQNNTSFAITTLNQFDGSMFQEVSPVGIAPTISTRNRIFGATQVFDFIPPGP